MRLIKLLETAPNFVGLSRADVEALDRIMMEKDYPDGHEFFKQGNPADTIYLIVDGKVAVTQRHSDDRCHTELKRMGSGEIFGEWALIDHSRRSACCTAVGPVRVASLPRSAFELLYMANSPLPYHFLQIIARQLARDLRSLVGTLRGAIFEGSNAPLRPYDGPERRSDRDRRKGERRGMATSDR
ncbi:MAG: Crp/Fnr family transcriptional regulator [Thiogranum sp.]